MAADRDEQPSKQSAGLIDTVKAVGASFFGVRGRRAHERDVARLNPVHVIIAGIMLALVFVLSLVLLVRAIAG